MSIFCQCCLNKCDDQVNMSSPVNNQGILEVYEEMLQYSTGIQLQEDSVHYICNICICKLRESCIFKNQVEETQSRLTIIAFESFHIKTEYDIEDTSIKNDDSSSDGDENINNLKPASEVPIIFDNNEEYDLRTKSCDTEKEQSFDDSFSKNFNLSSKSESDINLKQVNQLQRNKPRRKSSPLKCKKCKTTFSSNEEYDFHTMSCNTSFICPECGKTFQYKNLFEKHMLSHAAKVECNICNKFISQGNLKQHEKSHKGETLYTCRKCPERFKYYLEKQKHMIEVHGAEQPVFPCNTCSRTFSRATIRNSHIRKHHFMEKKHFCSECSMGFYGKSELDDHMLIHTGERNFECQICHKRYARKKTLTEHTKIHFNIKEYKCDICRRFFKKKCAFIGHLKSHTQI